MFPDVLYKLHLSGPDYIESFPWFKLGEDYFVGLERSRKTVKQFKIQIHIHGYPLFRAAGWPHITIEHEKKFHAIP
jgi:hypothetical protein